MLHSRLVQLRSVFNVAMHAVSERASCVVCQSKFVPRHHTQATIESAQDGAEHDANEPSDLDARLQAVSVVEHGSSTDDESA